MVWTLIRQRKWLSPILGFKFGSSLFLAEIWQNILAYCSCPLPLRYGLWYCLLGFLLSAYTFLGITLLVIVFLVYLPLIYWPANAPVWDHGLSRFETSVMKPYGRDRVLPSLRTVTPSTSTVTALLPATSRRRNSMWVEASLGVGISFSRQDQETTTSRQRPKVFTARTPYD